MKPITADSFEGRALLALRAGSMSAEEAVERWPTSGTRTFQALLKIGFVDYDGDRYALTTAGRAACPCRNPMAATVAPAIHSPEVFTMPKGETRITRDKVLAFITSHGAAGVHRKDLIAHFKCPESTIDNHLMHLSKGNTPAIFKPRPGQCVASHIPVLETATGEVNPKAAPQPELAVFSAQGERAVTLNDLGLNHLESTEIHTEEVETIDLKPVPDRRAPIIVEDGEDLEIGIFSNGQMSIQIEAGLNETEIRLSASAVIKLRRFLGLFQEAA